ncbi:amino acid adenylation domain-containing protein [Aquimarina sp. D1M17]|uniref:non-ribosomal peptide synthetase n=1 Tax=Aquimarina acroporae TaxID=2937283 RepID=UPI0020BF5178|nr:non-ribosomal peptide synthetase [Aquimarina acroporae]MCK8524320.1 amino acid adenylation domain-containing protein [Aquimarina acroporae]
MEGQTLQEIFLNNINSKEESGITFIESKNDIQYLSYKKLYLEASYKLHALQQVGLCPGDELVFQFQSNKNFVVTFWACVLGGFIPVPIVLGTTSDIAAKIAGVWKKLKNPYIISDVPEFKNILKEFSLEHDDVINDVLSNFIDNDELVYSKKAVPVTVSPSDLVFIQFSSGSTGTPKGVTNTQESIIYNVGVSLDKFNIQEADKLLGWMPLTHDMGLIFFHILPLLVNANQCLMSPMLFLSAPEVWIESLSKEQITISGSPNFGFVHVLKNLERANLENLSFDKLRVLINSAEPVSIEVCREFEKVFEKYGLAQNTINPAYGLAEAVLGVSAYYKEDAGLKEFFIDRGELSIGTRIKFEDSTTENVASFADLGSFLGTEIKITDEHNKELPEDTLGIIQLKSPAITSSYYNDPEASAKVISKDGWFNTGDIGFLHEDHLVITGRQKEMIIINGQNYFPNDLDKLLEELPEIQFQHAISCNIFDEKKHEDELYIFLQFSGLTEDFILLANKIKKIVNDRIGIQVKEVVMVDKIPRTTSGKIQRYVLRKKFLEGTYDVILSSLDQNDSLVEEREYVAPSTDIEKTLVKIWEDFFEIDNISVTDNFFYLGGSSIGLGILASRIQEAFDIQIDVRTLFTKTDFQDQVALITEAGKAEPSSIIPIPDREYYPLFDTQKRLFVDHQIDKNSLSYNTPVVLEVKGELDVTLCEQAFKQIIERHEILRTSFELKDGEPVQKVHDHVDFKIQIVESTEKNVQNLLQEYIKPFDLTRPPLVRVLIQKENDVYSKIIIDVHHIVIDAASFEILIREFESLCKKETLDPLKLQYRDFVVYEKTVEEHKNTNDQKKFWLDQFSELPESIKLPNDYTNRDLDKSEGNSFVFEIHGERKEKLQALCKKEQVTMSTLTLTIFYVLLAKLSNQEDIVLGTSTLGRWKKELRNSIGLFINTLALRSYPEGEKSFVEFLREVNTNVIDCLSNEQYSFDQLLSDLDLKSKGNSNPLFDITFEYHNFDWSDIELSDFKLSRLEHSNFFARFDLALRIVEKNGIQQCSLDYRKSLFELDTVKRFAEYYESIIDEIINNESIVLKDINVLSEQDYTKLLEEFNSSEPTITDGKNVIEVFSEQVRTTPNQVALVYNEKSLTYLELDEKSTNLAKNLLHLGVERGDKVGVMMTRSLDFIVSVLGVIKTGAAYFPIDTNLPESRKSYMLNQCDAKLILTNVEKPNLELDSNKLVNVSELRELNIQNSSLELPKLTQEDVMYVIFTSGSTGAPKGVVMQQKGVLNLVKGLKARVYNTYPNKTLNVCLLASYAFDASIQQIFGALLMGHSLYVADDETRKDGEKLLKFYNQNNIDVSDGTPTHLRFFTDSFTEKSRLSSLSSWIVAGEVLSKDLVKTFYEKSKGSTQLYNFYGPTETCVDTTSFKVDQNELEQYDQIPIGRPLPNERVYITDKYGNLVPPGTIGELCIAGEGLASGYIGDTALTLSKFCSNWVEGENTVYRTGDLAKWLSNGNLEYCGRKDDHVKIRGFRIHIGEIESVLNRIPDVNHSVVIVKEGEKEEKQLIGYIVSDKEISSKEIQKRLALDLPEYMIPRAYVQMPSFPTTNSGKVDKKALPLPIIDTNYVEPTTELEQQLASFWQEILAIEKVGIHDNFYELGGDSIKAIQLASKCKTVGLHFQVKDIFNHQTISQIVSYIKESAGTLQEKGVLSGPVKLHPIQKHFFERGYKDISHYNQSMMFKVSKSVTVEVLNFALEELVKYHDVLRMSYDSIENSIYPLQSYNSRIPKVIQEEVSSVEQIPARCQNHQKDLDIFKGNVLKAVWFETGDNDLHNRLLIVMHHLVVDGVSQRIIIEDLTSLIEQKISGDKPALPEKQTSYRQWNKKLIDHATSSILEKEHIYWKEVLSNYNPLPVDIINNDSADYNATDKIQISLPSDLTRTLIHDAHSAFQTNINDILICALTLALSDWLNDSKVVVGLEGHGREELFKDTDINRTIGWFTSLYPICLNLKNVNNIAMLIADTKDMLRGIPNKGIGFNLLRTESKSEIIRSNLSAFYEDITFNYLGSFDTGWTSERENVIELTIEDTGNTIGDRNVNKHKLSIDSLIKDGQLHMEWKYDAKCYNKTTVQELADNYVIALEKILQFTLESEMGEQAQEKVEDFEIFSI